MLAIRARPVIPRANVLRREGSMEDAYDFEIETVSDDSELLDHAIIGN